MYYTILLPFVEFTKKNKHFFKKTLILAIGKIIKLPTIKDI